MSNQSIATLRERRRFLAAAVATTALLPFASPAHAAEAISLRPSFASDLFRVRMELDIKGNVNLAQDPLVPQSKKRQVPLTGDVKLDFEERYLRPDGAASESLIIAVERHYHEAVGTSRLNGKDQTVQIRPDAARILARREHLPEVIYSNDTFLTQDELNLLSAPLAGCSLDHLMPAAEMSIGQTAPIDGTIVASVFNLSGVAAAEVTLELVDFDADSAKLQLRGKVDGSVSGVPTVQRLVGKLTFDRRTQTVSWAAVAIHETREIGKSVPGFDLTATIRMIRQPLASPQKLPTQAATIAFDQPVPKDRLLKAVGSDFIGVAALLDRRWHLLQDSPGEAVLRMIDNETTIAQCNLRRLPQLKTGEQLTMTAFQADCRRTLGSQMSGMLQSDEAVTDAGLRALRVTAAGSVQGVPIHWILLHFSDDTGRRVLATLTMDGDSVPRLDGSDVQFIATMTITGTGYQTTATGEIPSGAAKTGLESKAKASENVISASDLGPKKR